MNNQHSYQNGSTISDAVGRVQVRPGLLFGAIMLTALLAFEIFNFSTTDFALRDLLGELTFASIHWATILSIAFCGIDFAGIARLFMPEQNGEESKEVWYLFGAWFLAATMNAVLTWWGVSMAITNHAIQSTTVIDPNMLTRVVPIFVALMVWVIRILIIGSLSIAIEQYFTGRKSATLRQMPSRSYSYMTRPDSQSIPQPYSSPVPSLKPAQRPATARSFRGSSSGQQQTQIPDLPEPTYHSLTRTERPQHRPTQNKGSGSRKF